jgi:hypothetical protein
LSTSNPFETLENRQLLSGNAAPLAIDDFYDVPANHALAVNVADGVLSNDEGACRSIPVVVSAPENGTLVLNKNGAFTYTPKTGYTGDDLFTYAFKDDPENTAYVCLNIVDTPIARDDSYNSANGKFITVNKEQGVLANDVNFDGLNLKASVVDAPSNGKLLLNPSGAFIYLPNKGFEGDDSFTYTIDGTNSVATVDLVFSKLTIISGGKVNTGDDEDVIIHLKPRVQNIRVDSAPKTEKSNPVNTNPSKVVSQSKKTSPFNTSSVSDTLLKAKKSLL